MYDVLDVCRHIINYSNEKKYGISNLKLQKVLYIVQAYFVSSTEFNEPCFEQAIEAWAFGPVVPVAYREYRSYGALDIPSVRYYYDWADGEVIKFDYKDDVIADEHKEVIDSIVDRLSSFSASSLVTMTHNQKPWKDAYADGDGRGSEITIDAIREYFSE